MFVLTPGSTNDYEITSQFIQTMNQVVAEKIKLVICLDSLSHAGNLTIHVGSVKSDQEEYAKSILKTLKHSAALNNKHLNFQKKFTKGNFYEWEHIRYSENNIAAITITSDPKKSFNHPFEKFDLFDTKFDLQAFRQNVEVIAEFLVRVQYGIENEDKYIVDMSIDEESIT